jgi:hypothetical protein
MNKHSRTKLKLQVTALVTGALLSGSVFAMGMRNAPCDGFMDCIYTAAWYAFWR